MKWLAVMLPLVACAWLASAQGDIEKQVEMFLRSAEPHGFAGSVLIGKGDDVLGAVSIGARDLEGEHPNTPETLFEIASLTKSFTAAAVMRLVEQGKVELCDSIADHLPGIPENCRGITIEHLLRHTSGIPGSNAQGRGDKLEAVLPTFLAGGPRHEPGTNWAYWNQGYALLSEIIARASGMPYTEFCRKELFERAGMASTCFTGDDPPKDVPVAIGRSLRGPARSALEHPYGSYGFQYRGMGGLVTNVRDLWTWHRALRDHTVLGKEATTQLFEPGLNDYALGWFVRSDPKRGVVQSHGGGVRGFICEMRRYPDHGDAVIIVLCNRDDAPLGPVIQGLEKILFGEEATPVPSPLGPLKAIGADLAAELVGRYIAEQGTVIEVSLENDLLRARIHWGPPNGPVTRAVVGWDEQGEVAIYDGSSALPILIERDAEGNQIESIYSFGRSFKRAK